jgi:hypothetical protein
MAKVQLRDEIMFKAPTRVGLLADVADALSDAGVDIRGIGAYDKGGFGEFLLLTSDDRASKEALAALGGEVDMTPVVVVEVANDAGVLARLARRISNAGLNISQIHATTTAGADMAQIIMRTDDEPAVVELLADF